MDINAYSYVVLVAGLGMVIVFLFLWFLSGLMSLIARWFGDKQEPPAAEKAPAESPAARSSAQAADSRAPAWLLLAVTTFLDAESREQAPDPWPWASDRAHHGDPWLGAPSRRDL